MCICLPLLFSASGSTTEYMVTNRKIDVICPRNESNQEPIYRKSRRDSYYVNSYQILYVLKISPCFHSRFNYLFCLERTISPFRIALIYILMGRLCVCVRSPSHKISYLSLMKFPNVFFCSAFLVRSPSTAHLSLSLAVSFFLFFYCLLLLTRRADVKRNSRLYAYIN